MRSWHPEALRLFIEKGLRDHPASRYTDQWRFKGVTLACTKSAEYASARAGDHHIQAVAVYHKLFREGPALHLILSEQDEFGATVLKEDMCRPEPISQCTPKSVQWMKKGGHMFVQTVPGMTAQAIYDVLITLGRSGVAQPSTCAPQARL